MAEPLLVRPVAVGELAGDVRRRRRRAGLLAGRPAVGRAADARMIREASAMSAQPSLANAASIAALTAAASAVRRPATTADTSERDAQQRATSRSASPAPAALNAASAVARGRPACCGLPGHGD